MTHRERFISVVTHRGADRAVYDLCGSPQTFIDYQITKDRLMEIYNLKGDKQGNYCIDERILEMLDIDTRIVGGMVNPETSFNRMEKGVIYDNWGIGRQTSDGRYEICFHPLKDCGIDEMLAYEFPNPDNTDMRQITLWAEEAKYLRENTEYAVIAEHPVLGIFELGCWMLGFEDYLYRIAADPEFVNAFSERVLTYQKRIIEIYYGALGRFINCTTSGDDFGTQAGPFMSKKMFDAMVKPYMKERVNYTKIFTDGFYKHHTCGSVFDLIPSLIDCGIDILNPIQPGAYMMEPERLKAAYGNKIAFWG